MPLENHDTAMMPFANEIPAPRRGGPAGPAAVCRGVFKKFLLLLVSLGVAAAPGFAQPQKAVVESTEAVPPSVGVFSKDERLSSLRFLFEDRGYGPGEDYPAWLDGSLFFKSSMARPFSFKCVRAGRAVILAPEKGGSDAMRRMGFSRMEGGGPFYLFHVAGSFKNAAPYEAFAKELAGGEQFTVPARSILADIAVPNRPAQKPPPAALMESMDEPGAKVLLFASRGPASSERLYFDNRAYGPGEPFPAWLEGTRFFQSSGSRAQTYRCRRAGTVIAIAKCNETANETNRLAGLGFVPMPFKPFPLYK
ncbi:MAG: hypothetical protein LBC18_03945, partial [Opitutaceae bacterium]|nr:hypothetical protein [Opitutaceae bacterium]